MALYVSDQSREIGFATPETIAEALTYLHRDGVLVLGNAIEVEHLDRLREQLQPEAEEIAKNPTHHFNFGRHTRNMDQAPPTMVDLMFEDVWAKRIAVSILQSLLGPNLMCHYANGNTALKAEGRQPVHSDIDKPHPLYPFAYAINIPLSDMNVENGSTELWPGSHRESKIDQHVTVTNEEYGLAIKPALVEQRRHISPPVQPTIRKGSLIIRDIRLWHAGMPNRTDTPRIMLTFVIQPKWFQAPSKVTLPLKSKALVDSWKANSGLEYEAHWVDGDVDHRKVNSDDVDFSTGNSKLLELEPLMYPAPRSTSSL
ncbi:hypothetical protein D0869_00544 [Hortaea werneckii]|uniref:Fe2OG dioxygenase domain-containing protein n=1 Tax=Hortaea werneckii TaxID=91943 RepID=A0A3M6XGD9_HORWE|nr:hypothetical protein D0869_00544 [Hortaea werneckii]